MYEIAAFCTKNASIIAGVYVNKLSQSIAGLRDADSVVQLAKVIGHMRSKSGAD